MINIAHVHLENSLILDPAHPMILIEENAHEFRTTVETLRDQLSGEEGDFAFSEGGKLIKAAERGIMITDIFGLEFSDRKLTSAIGKAAERNFEEGEQLPLLNAINSEVREFIERVTYEFPFAVEFDDLTVSDIFKAAGLRAAEHYGNFLEKLICYTSLISGLRPCSFIVFVNLRSVLSDEELHAFYEHMCGEKIALLLIESYKVRPLLSEERAVIITDDLCELVEYHNDP